MNRDELPPYVKEFIRRAVASRLRIRRDDFFTSPDAQASINDWVMIIKAIADHKTNDGAVDELLAKYAERGEVTSRRNLVLKVEECYRTFNLEIAGCERMHEMNRRNMEAKHMWDLLRSRVPIDSQYDDNWMRVADALILRDVVIPLPLDEFGSFQ